MAYKLISIVIINKDDEGIKNTLQAIRSIKKPLPIELIVIDASENRLDYIKNKFSEVIWIDFKKKNPKKKYTIPEQRNLGVTKASGEIIVFIDANCIPDSEWLNNLTWPILNAEEKVVAGVTFSSGTKTLHDDAAKVKTEYLSECPTINLAFRKVVYTELAGFDENFDYGSDVDFSWRLQALGYKIKFARGAIITHDWGDRKQELKREYLYGRARSRLYIKHPKSLRAMISRDPVIFIYPVFLLGLPITFFYPFYPFLILVLCLKNIKHKPLLTVVNHLFYGYGAIAETVMSIFSSPFTAVRRLRLCLAYIASLAVNILPLMFSLPHFMKLIIFFGVIILPGYLISHIYNFPRQILWPLRVAISLLIIMLSGLLINTLFAILHLQQPLELVNLALFSIIFSSVLYFFALKKSKIVYLKKIISVQKFDIIMCLLFVVFTMLCVVGAIRLNNQESSAISIIALSFLGILTFVLTLRSNSQTFMYKWCLYFAGLGLLYLFSLRGGYVNGWDIQSEMQVLNLTQANNKWNINLLRDAYNASLSLNILPTILGNYLKVGGDYIFKLYYPLITAFCLPVIFSIARKFLPASYAFLISMFFIAQAQFMQQLPALARQQIAFLFFFLLIFTCLTKINKSRKFLLQISLGIGMILSHYSTAYVALALLLAGVLSLKIINIASKKKAYDQIISTGCLVLLFLITIFWYGQLTNTSNSLKTTAINTASGLLNPSAKNSKSETVAAALPGYSSPSVDILKKNYISTNISNSVYLSRLQKVSVANEVATKTDATVPRKSPLLTTAISQTIIIIRQFFKVGIIIGVGTLIILFVKRNKSDKIQNLVVLSVACLLLLTAIVALPRISLNYNTERLYQQLLPIVGIGFFIFLYSLKNIVKRDKITRVFVGIAVLIYLYGYIGFTSSVFGGIPTLKLSIG